MGYVMRLCCGSRYFWIIFLLFSVSFNVNAVTWSSVGFDFWLDEYGDSKNKGDLDLSKCKLNPSLMEEEGNKSDAGQYVESRYSGGMFLIVHYGKAIEGKKYGRWGYAQRFTFPPKLSDNYKKPLFAAFKKALSAGNCDIANAILDAMQNPDIRKNGDSEFLGFKNGEDKCVVLSDGKTTCKGPSYKTSQDKDGKTRLDIDPNGGWERSLDDYSSSKPNDNINNPGSSDNKNKGDGSGINEHRGNGSSSSGSGQANNGNNKPGDKGTDKNDGKPGNGGNGGSSIGNGKGEGEGDDEGKDIGDVKMPKLQTPDLEKTLNAAKKQIEDKVGSGYELSKGQCEPISISVFSHTEIIDLHCQVFEKLGSTAGPAFTLLWTTLGVLIILSA